MKVTNNKVGTTTPQNAKASEANKTDKVDIRSVNNQKTPPSAAEVDASAKLNLSSRAQDMKKIKEAAMAAPDIDEAKVARFQKMIDEGKYKVSAEDIADKMVDEHLMTN